MRSPGYAQFCPVAKASELLAERWMPLVVRELLEGGRRYAELRRGIPRISPSVLSARLRALVDAGVVRRVASSRHREYVLTEAGEELQPVIRALGVWGQRWAQRELRAEQLDPELLVWVMRRRFQPRALGVSRAVLEVEFLEAPTAHRSFWFLVDSKTVDLCVKHPGRPVDLAITTTVRTLTQVFLGQLPPERALRSGALVLSGSRTLARGFSRWCPRSRFAEHARPAEGPRRIALRTT